jgi:hypothetical protein
MVCPKGISVQRRGTGAAAARCEAKGTSTMFALFAWLIFILLAFAVAWWIVGQISLPPPMRMIVNVVFGLLALLVLFWLFSSFVGPPQMGHFGPSRLNGP